MTKKDLKTGMTCKMFRDIQYMIYITPDDRIALIPISSIIKKNDNGSVVNFGLNLNSIFYLKKDMGDDLIDRSEYDLVNYGLNNDLRPYQIEKIWHAKNPLDLFSFKDEDLIWNLK